MTTRILILGFLITVFHTQLFAQQAPRPNVHIGFVYPLSTNGVHAPEYTNDFSLHALTGVSRSETGFCASGLASVIRDTATGFVASGLANIIGKDAKGAQFAGFINYTGNHVNGCAAAGFINIAGSTEGVAAAGFANIVLKDAKGLQAAGFINYANSAKDATIAGFANIVLKDTTQFQAAGFINEGHNVNTQVAGFINVANEVKGAQVAGFINIARKVKGVQLAGFVNIADSSDCPIGLINLIKNGEQAIGLTVDETGTTIAAFRSGGKWLYGIVGFGVNPTYSGAYAVQAGMGSHLCVSRSFRFNIEASSTWLYDFMGNSDIRSGFRFMPAVRFGPVELFAGPSFNYTATADMQGLGKTGYSVWNERYNDWSHDFSIGLEAGIQFHLDKRVHLSKIISEK